MEQAQKVKGRGQEEAKVPAILQERIPARKDRAAGNQAEAQEKAAVPARAAVEGNKFQPKKGKQE